MQGVLDDFLSEVLDLVITAADPRPGEAVLDIGCGAGATTVTAARLIWPQGTILGADISRPLIEFATKRATAEGLSNVGFQLGDAQTHPFDRGRFDLLISRFGVMFFADPVAAFRNMARALRPAGRIAFAAWAGPDGNPWFSIPAEAAVTRLGPVDAPDPTAPGPMAFRDIDRVVGILQDAGLTNCSGTEWQVTLCPPGGFNDALDLAVSFGPASRIIAAKNGTEADRVAIAEVCRTELAAFRTGDSLRIPGRVNLFRAEVPGPDHRRTP